MIRKYELNKKGSWWLTNVIPLLPVYFLSPGKLWLKLALMQVVYSHQSGCNQLFSSIIYQCKLRLAKLLYWKSYLKYKGLTRRNCSIASIIDWWCANIRNLQPACSSRNKQQLYSDISHMKPNSINQPLHPWKLRN